MKIDINYVANLARLQLSDSEKELFGSQLGQILDYIHQLNEVNTDEIEPTAHILAFMNVSREDNVSPSIEQASVMRNAPESKEGFFVVPRIIE